MNQKANTTNPAKYRPVLTATQIAHMLALCKREQPLSNESLSLISTLSPFMAKIENAGIVPAYTIKGTATKSLLDRLGGGSSEPCSNQPAQGTDAAHRDGVLKEVYWEQSYQAYKADPASCSLAQIEAAREWMYLHELFSPTEKEEFEASMMQSLGAQN